MDLVEGQNLLDLDIPDGALSGDTYDRFRISSTGGLAPTGLADDGEVEDYQVMILDGSGSIGTEAKVASIEQMAPQTRAVLVDMDEYDQLRMPEEERWRLATTVIDD